MIGYLCAYLRYYHPYEFITAFLNNANNQDDIINGSNLAKLYGIDIVNPKFGISKSDYMYDKNKHVIAKGTSSIKFLNSSVSNQLFSLSNNTYNTFISLLYDLSEKTSLNKRQLYILTILDYFSFYGNANELIEISKVFDRYKNGSAKQIAKSSITNQDEEKIIRKYCSDAKKDGSISKTYTIKDIGGLLKEYERYIRLQRLPDIPLIEKINAQKEYLGYVDIATNKKDDMYKLLINEVTPLKGKYGEPWAYKLSTQSICTGKESCVNVGAEIYNKKPIKKMNIINVQTIRKNKSGFFYIYKYEIIEEGN